MDLPAQAVDPLPDPATMARPLSVDLASVQFIGIATSVLFDIQLDLK
jgi:hypothetical protein